MLRFMARLTWSCSLPHEPQLLLITYHNLSRGGREEERERKRERESEGGREGGEERRGR